MALNIKKGKRGGKKERLVIHAEKGIGKTTFGSQAPKAIFLPLEDGCSEVDGLAMFDKQTTFTGAMKCLQELIDEKHDYETVVVDTYDALVEVLSSGVMNRDYQGNVQKFNSFGVGNQAVAQEMKSFLNRLDELRDKGMRVIVLCHSGILNVKNPNGDDYQKLSLAVPKSTSGLLVAWADRVGHAGYEFKVKGGDDSENRKGKVVQRDTERYLWFNGTASVEAKTRVGYEMKQDKILFTYNEYKENQR